MKALRIMLVGISLVLLPFVIDRRLQAVGSLMLRTQSRGMYVYLSHPCSPNVAFESNRTVVLQFLSGGGVRINSDSFAEGQIPDTIATVMDHRYERVLYIVADDDVPYGRVVALIARIRQTTKYLVPVLLPQRPKGKYMVDWCVSSQDILPSDQMPNNPDSTSAP